MGQSACGAWAHHWPGLALLTALAFVGPVFAARDAGALVAALRDADEVRAAALIEQRIGLNTRDEAGATPLMWAAQRHNKELAARLLDAGANPNQGDEDGLTPLQVAIGAGATDVALLLISRGADPRSARKTGETVLMTAARKGQLEVMKQLIAKGAAVNARESRFHQTALMWSAGNPEQVKLLIAHGADVHARTRVWNVTNTIYTELIAEGAPWLHDGEYVSRKGGQSALFFAIQKDDLESVKALLDAGVSADDRAADGSNALLLALYKWNGGGERYGTVCDLGVYPLTYKPNLDIATLLLERGAKVAVADAAGYTPLHAAVLGLLTPARQEKCPRTGTMRAGMDETFADPRKSLALVSRMLTLGANPNASTRYPTPGPIGHVRINPAHVGSSPLHIAASSGNMELVELLLAHGADPNLARKDGHTPLSVATKSNELATLELLVAHGGDVRRTYDPAEAVTDVESGENGVRKSARRTGQTLLHIAAIAGAYDVVPFLIEKGLSRDVKNDQGETPFLLADMQERLRHQLALATAEGNVTLGIEGPTRVRS